ncbi:MAG TPA: hypothetical protein VNO50_05175 [Pyrinomonadaceae bacterium]|nr:hypothetical protein [Pyrinomonadaceae bacterium]
MKSRLFGVNEVAGCLAAGIFVLSVATPSLAQRGAPPGAGPPPIITIKREEHGRRSSEAKLRSAELEASAEAESQKHIQAAITNMKQDFTRIQVLRNDIARSLIAKKPLDYALVTEQTGEISRRAHRLNVYMLAHAPENKEPRITATLKSEEMVGALVKLCKLIDSFTENPALKNAAMVDAKGTEKAKDDKAKADADLLAIIELSESINKQSASLKPHK